MVERSREWVERNAGGGCLGSRVLDVELLSVKISPQIADFGGAV